MSTLDYTVLIQAEIDKLEDAHEDDPPNLDIKGICQTVYDEADAASNVTSEVYGQILNLIDSHKRYNAALAIINSAPSTFKDSLTATLRLQIRSQERSAS